MLGRWDSSHIRSMLLPIFKFNGICILHRYQTTINTTLNNLYSSSRHLLSAHLMLLSVDASNPEAMQAFAASPREIRSIGTIVTSIVDSVDTLLDGDLSATLEITNATYCAVGSTLNLTVDFRFPLVDYFFPYMHLGTSTIEQCPPFKFNQPLLPGTDGLGVLHSPGCCGMHCWQSLCFLRLFCAHVERGVPVWGQ